MVAGIEEGGGGGVKFYTVCFKGGSRKCSVVATKILNPPPTAINNDRSLICVSVCLKARTFFNKK